jgi:hypothetical protein
MDFAFLISFSGPESQVDAVRDQIVPQLQKGFDKCGVITLDVGTAITGEAGWFEPEMLSEISARYPEVVIWFTAAFDNGDDVDQWRYQGTACQTWMHYVESRYDEQGNEIGWHRRTYIRDGVVCDPPIVEMEDGSDTSRGRKRKPVDWSKVGF